MNAYFFKVEVDKNISDEFSYLLEKSPYTSENEIAELFSHLVYVDEAQKEKNLQDLKLNDKAIKLRFILNDNGENKVENLHIPLGQGHFSKGINHLREIGKINWENDIKENSLSQKLSEIFDKYLTKPPVLDIAQQGTLATLQKCADILETVPSPELQEFLTAFMGDKKQTIKYFSNNENKKEDREQEKSKEEKIADLKAKVKNFSEKKSNIKERAREITNHKDRGIYA